MKKAYFRYLFLVFSAMIFGQCSKPYSEALPTVQVTSVSAYGMVDTVLVTGTITSQGASPIQYEGFCFSNTPTFEILSRQVLLNSTTTTFTAVIPAYHDSTFYFEAIAANQYGYCVSKPYPFTVPAAKPDSAPCGLSNNSFIVGSNSYPFSGVTASASPYIGSYDVTASFSGGYYYYDVYFNQVPTNGIYSVLSQSDFISNPYSRYVATIQFIGAYPFNEGGYVYVAQNKDGSTTLSFCSLTLFYISQSFLCSSKVTFN